MKEILEEDLRNIIRDAAGPNGTHGSQKSLAQAMGKSAQLINNILLRKAPISNNVARFFGYRLIKKYQQIKKGAE